MPIHSQVPLYTAAQARELDRVAIETFALPGYDLMRRAGGALFRQCKLRWPEVRSITMLCGAGNNAGDGYVVARELLGLGYAVRVAWLKDPETLTGDAGQAAADYLQSGGEAEAFRGELPGEPGLIIDALLGTGLAREVRGEWAAAIECMNASPAPVLSADIPSGLDADSGRVRGVAVEADCTVTFIGRKRGLYTAAGVRLSGQVVFDDLQVPAGVYAEVPVDTWVMETARLRRLLPARPRDAHKGCFGHVLVIGGEPGLAGAVRLAAEAAARAGSGLVSVATHAGHAAAISAARPELMCHAVTTAGQLRPLLARASVVVIGPGLGQGAWGRQMFMEMLQSDLPLVVDADALNLLAREPAARGNWVITPHPGEAARLLDTSTDGIQSDRFAAVQRLADRYRAVAVLKGAGSLVTTDSGPVLLCDRGNPGMASGGMGDVLSGVIAGLAAQRLDLFEAAWAGVLVHAIAADTAAGAGERGLLAGDVLDALRGVVNGGV